MVILKSDNGQAKMEEPGGPRPTVEELQSLTVVKLRQRLAQYGIPQSGTKRFSKSTQTNYI